MNNLYLYDCTPNLLFYIIILGKIANCKANYYVKYFNFYELRNKSFVRKNQQNYFKTILQKYTLL